MNSAARAILLVMLMLCSSMLPFIPPALEAEGKVANSGGSTPTITLIRGFSSIVNSTINNSDLANATTVEVFPANITGMDFTGNANNLSQLSLGYDFSCIILEDGTLKCWGENDKGQLGQTAVGSYSDTPIQVDLGNDRTAISIATGGSHACAILDDGSLKCWGSNLNGELGLGNNTQQNFPVHVDLGSGRTATSIAIGYRQTCAILDDGSLKCWGYNNFGQLGIGNNSDQNTPVQVDLGSGRTATSIAAGQYHTCAILDNSSLKCWGYNNNGQLGLGNITLQYSPVHVDLGSGRTTTSIAAGFGHTCAILDNGSLNCWGYNNYGQLGLGNATQQNTPVHVGLSSGRTAISIATSSTHTCAILDNGSLNCWGRDNWGQVGVGCAIWCEHSSPTVVNVSSGRTAISIATGNSHTCATLDNSSLKCWGGNLYGQLGLGNYGSNTNQNTPVQVNLSDINGDHQPFITKGLFFGSPDTLMPPTNYTLWANTSSTSISDNLSIEVVPALEYSSTNLTLTRWTQMTPLVGNVTGGPYNVSISPTLPAGLIINTSTGAISGTPTEWTSTRVNHTITVSNSSGSDQIFLLLKVDDIPPNISYSQTNISLIRNFRSPLPILTNSGGDVGSWSVSPSFPVGVALVNESKPKAIDVARDSSCAISSADEVYCWGKNFNGMLSNNYTGSCSSGGGSSGQSQLCEPGLVVMPNSSKVREIGIMGLGACALLENYSLYCWGSEVILGVNTSTHGHQGTNFPQFGDGTVGVKTFGLADNGVCAILLNASLYCYDQHNNNGTPFQYDFGNKKPISVSDGWRVLFEDGDIYSLSPYSGSYTNVTSSFSIPSGRTPLAIDFDCVLLDNRSLHCRNGGGVQYLTFPLPVIDFNGAGRWGCAILENESVACWNTTQHDTYYHVDMPIGRTALNVVSGDGTSAHSCAILDNGSVACWGANVYGQLGDRTNSSSTVPVFALLPTNVSMRTQSAEVGSISGVAVTLSTNRTHQIWGNNSEGASSFNMSIEVLPALEYGNNTLSLTRNVTMTPHTPVINGGPYDITISPPLPSGLSLNNTTGEITGTPTLNQIMKQYMITASNSSGADQFPIYIGIAEIPPSISYSNSNYSFIRGWAIDSEGLISDGGNIDTLRSNDTMPYGLTINEEDISRITLTANDDDLRFFIATDGHIYGWGNVFNGRIGTNSIGRSGTGLDQVDPTIFTLFMPGRAHAPGNPSIDYEAIEIRTLGEASCALFSNNSIGCWGDNDDGILGFNHSFNQSYYGDKDNCPFPANHTNSEVACGGWLESLENQVRTFSLYNDGIDRVNGCAILLNDELWCWGRNVGNSEHNATPRKVDLNGRRAEQILDSECVLLHDGNITCWSTIDNTTDVSLPAGRTAIQVGYGCAILDNHSVYCWSGSVTWPPMPYGLKPIRLQTNGCMILSNGSAYCVPQSGNPFYAPQPPSRTFIAIDDYRVDSNGVPAGGCGLLDNTSIICWGGWSGNGTSGVIAGEYGWATMPTGVGGLNPGGIFGTLSGTPLIEGQFHRTIWGNNSLGASSFNMSIEVLLALDYGNPTIGLTRNVTMPTATPIITGGPYTLSISPSLPSGLYFNNTTGVISGTPLFNQDARTYYISVSNSSGADVIEITIGIADVAPILNYSETNLTYVRGFWNTPLHPILSGGNVASWEISPSLPPGLIFSSNPSNNFEKPLNTGDRYTLSITESGKVLISDWSGMSYLSIPSTAHPIAIETTAYRTNNALSTYAIRFDNGSVWWNNSFLQVYQNEYVIDVALAERHWCYLLDSGIVRCWGTNEYGGFGDGTPASNIWRNQTNTSNVTLPAGRFATEISSGGGYTCAILDNMELFCWGDVPSIPSLISANNITQLDTGYIYGYGICALLDIGSISCSTWAGNGGNYNPPTGRTFKQLGGGKILCALLDNNSVVCYSNSLNDWEYVQFPSGIIPSYLSVRWGTACVIIQDGRQMCWGEGSNLQLGNGNSVDSTTPVFSTLPSGESIHRPFQIGCIFGSSQVSTNAITYTVWANNSLGSSHVNLTIMVLPGVEYPSAWLNLTRNATMSPFLPVININDINLSIYPPLPAGLVFNYTTGEISGTPLVPWQPIEYTVSLWNSSGYDTFKFTLFVSEILPNATYEHSNHDELVGFAIEPIIASNDAGTVHQWGISPPLPAGLDFLSYTVGQTFSAGQSSTCAIYSDDTLRCWGANDMGQLGDGNVTSSSIPVLVNFNDGATPIEVAVGGEHACAIMNDGSVRCWGRNDVGQVGRGTICIYGSLADGCNGNFGITASSTVLLPTDLNATSISAGISHTCALMENGAVYCWGSNSNLQNGDGTSDDLATPAIASLPVGRYAVSLGVGNTHSCAVLDNGSAICWGANSFGQLGDGSAGVDGTYRFVQLPAGRSIVEIRGGGAHTCALLDAGDVACWGRNTHGQLGDGTTIGKITPLIITLPGALTATSLSLGDLHSCAILDSGEIACWGSNQNGLIGGGGQYNTTPSMLVLPDGLSLSSLSAGEGHTCGLTSTSRLVCIGDNGAGQLGDGSQINQPSLDYVVSIQGAIITTPHLPAGSVYGTPETTLASTTYTIYTNNSIGQTNFSLTLSIQIPLDYPTNSLILLRDRVMAAETPNIANGEFLPLTITPNLIEGITLDSTTGVLSGIPLYNSTLTNYTITLSNSSGFYSISISIVIYEPAANISYLAAPFSFTRGVDIGEHTPVVEGGVIEFWQVEPSLPQGLIFTEGIISGTSLVNLSTTTFRVWGNNSGGVGWIDIQITILEPAPILTLQSNEFTLTRGESNLNLNVTNLGGMVSNWSITPALPAGLSFVDGQISGIPLVNLSTTTYVISSENSGGQHSISFNITINEPIPNIEYNPNQITMTRGEIFDMIVAYDTGGMIENWTITPALPSGLMFSDGTISGLSTVNSTAITYTITAMNSGGQASWIITIEILEPAPLITYSNNTIQLTKGEPMNSLIPSNEGGLAAAWSISPALPAGLFFDSGSGVIIGSPLVTSQATTYTISATSNGGESIFSIIIEIRDPLPEFSLPLTYLRLTEGVVMSQLAPISSGVVITGWSLTSDGQGLPSGLQFSAATGVISGTPLLASDSIIVTIIATNGGGQVSRNLTIIVLADYDGDAIPDVDDEDDDNDGFSDSEEMKDGTDPLNEESIPVEGFEFIVPGTSVSLGAWDILGVLSGFPLISWLMFSLATRNGRTQRFMVQLKEARTREEVEEIAESYGHALMIKLIGPHQAMRLERVRMDKDASLEKQDIEIPQEELQGDIEPILSLDQTSVLEEAMKEDDLDAQSESEDDEESVVESAPPIDLKGIPDKSGFEWTNLDGEQWYRVSGSGDDWIKWSS